MTEIEIDSSIAEIVGLNLPFHRCLNACAQFEAGLTDGGAFDYHGFLHDIVERDFGKPVDGFKVITANARQRSLAFLATIQASRAK